MFRSLGTRLTAMYVLAAVVLVLMVATAVTAFALSAFGRTSRETVEAIAHAVPNEVRLELSRHRTLPLAAPEIARNLGRPGVRLVIFGSETKRGPFRFLAATHARPDGGVDVITPRPIPAFGPPQPPELGAGPPHPPGLSPGPPPGRAPGPFGGPPGGAWARGYDRMAPFPFGLNQMLRLEPKTVEVPDGRVTIFPDPAPLARTIDQFWQAVLPAVALAALAAWFLGRYITGQALRPLVETTASLNRFAAGDFTPRAVVTSDRSEIGELVKAYNGAAAQVSAAFEERKAVEAQMRQFIADAGHELRTPLTVIMGFIDVLRRRAGSDPGSAKIYETMLAESRRMRALIDKLIVLARMENPQLREIATVDVSALADTVVHALQTLAPERRFTLDVRPGVLVRGSESELHEALSNLVENALKYAPDSPVKVAVRSEGEQALIEVADHGPGIDPIDQTHIFDRFYRGNNRGASEGFGLGLAIVKRVVERAGGAIALESRPGEGCRFTIRLPRLARGERAAIAV
jgi:two-component system, OmpR family, sensor kinase